MPYPLPFPLLCVIHRALSDGLAAALADTTPGPLVLRVRVTGSAASSSGAAGDVEVPPLLMSAKLGSYCVSSQLPKAYAAALVSCLRLALSASGVSDDDINAMLDGVADTVDPKQRGDAAVQPVSQAAADLEAKAKTAEEGKATTADTKV